MSNGGYNPTEGYDPELSELDKRGLEALVELIPPGLVSLVGGYVDYAKEVILERALPGIDGFKPSQRRILYTAKEIEKIKDLTKCANLVGATMKLHPHGDGPIYATLVRMTHSTGYQNVPFVLGKGTFGRVFSTDPPAASRYTECRFTDIAQELFDGMEGTTMVPSYDGKLNEPVLLPVSFPSILCNPTQGIAIGIAANIPGFNYHEVINATIELIETGDIKHALAPDYFSAGEYVVNPTELYKLMHTGKAKIKLRGKWHVDGKCIVITELPYYTTVTDIRKAMEEIGGWSEVRDESDFNGLRLVVECTSKRNVDPVLTEMLRVTNLQMTITSNIAVIVDNRPKVIGVIDVLRNWVEFRSGVVEKRLKLRLESLEYDIERYTTLVALLNNEENRSKFISLLANNETDVPAHDYLRSLFPESPESTIEWILDMKIRTLSGVGRRQARLDNLISDRAATIADLGNINGVIVRELRDLNTRYKFPRKTVCTNEDYVFENDDKPVVRAQPVASAVIIRDNFLKKLHMNMMTKDLPGVIPCMSTDVISFIDNKGRLLRVNLDNVEFVSEMDRGIYLPTYFGLDGEGFGIKCYEVVGRKVKGYVYADGFASVVDYSEWCDAQRNTRITANGVSDKAELICGELSFDKEYALLMTAEGRFGFVPLDFKRKHRTARTRVVNVKPGDSIAFVMELNMSDMIQLVSAPLRYVNKLSFLAKGDTFDSEYFEKLKTK